MSLGASSVLAGQPSAGQPWYWGAEGYGIFGNQNDSTPYFSMLPSPGPTLESCRPIALAGDWWCTMAVMSNGKVWQWLQDQVDATGNPITYIVPGLTGIVGVCEDDGAWFAWDSQGRVWWGYENYVQQEGPVLGPGGLPLESVISVWCGDFTALFTRSDGSVFESGWTSWGYTVSLAWLASDLQALSLAGSQTVIAASQPDGIWLFRMSDSTLVSGYNVDNYGDPPESLSQVTYSDTAGQHVLTGVTALSADESGQFVITNSGQLWELNLWYGTATLFIGPWGTDSVRNIYVNDYYALAVTSDSQSRTTAWFWQVGDTPQAIAGTTGSGVLSGVNRLGAVAGVGDVGFAYLVDNSDGSVWAWDPWPWDAAYGNFWQFQVDSFTSDHPKVIEVAIGAEHGLRLLADGTVSAAGDNSYGQLGNSLTTQPWQLPPPYIAVSGVSGVVAVSAGAYHSLALSYNGAVWAWGDDEFGQLADGGLVSSNTNAGIIQNLNNYNVVAISAGGFQSLALLSTSTVMQWGSATSGYGSYYGSSQYLIPAPVVDGSGNSVLAVAVATGFDHALILGLEGTVWAWGDNTCGQLGDGKGGYNGGTEFWSTTPVQVMLSDSITPLSGVIAIAAGDDFSLALTNSGTVYAWGENSSCQCGPQYDVFGNFIPCYPLAVPVSSLSCSGVDYFGVMITRIAAGSQHALVLSRSGTVWAWGDDYNGELGDNNVVGSTETACSAVPVQVHDMTGSGFLTNVVYIAAGAYTSAAIQTLAASEQSWLYQNIPSWTGYQHAIEYSVAPPEQWGATSFAITVSEGGSGVVYLSESPSYDPSTSTTSTLTFSATTVPGGNFFFWAFGSVMTDGFWGVGACYLTISVSDNLGDCVTLTTTTQVVALGDVGAAEAAALAAALAIGEHPLGSTDAITGAVNQSDLIILNARLNRLNVAPYTDADCDLTGDGKVTTADRVLLRLILNGQVIPRQH